MKNIAIIPARGGSKRLPRKNLLPFMGKPMFLWTYEAAVESKCFHTVLVSTEDDEIIDLAKKNNVNVHIRPKGLATDLAGCFEVCMHILEEYEKLDICFDNLCCLYATAPLRNSTDIQNTMTLLEDKSVDSAFATCTYSHSPYQALIPNENNFLSPAFPLVAKLKSQAIPTAYIGNGSTYAIKVSSFKKLRSFYGTSLKGYNMPQMRSVDIDTQEDYEIAVCFAEYLQKQGML